MNATTLELRGCSPTPLAHYLKALGILRLVSEQADADAQGWWQNDVFCLRSKYDEESLARFFLEDYKPTPIVVPWSGADFFNAQSLPRRENFLARWPESAAKNRPKGETVIEAFLLADSSRLAGYREMLGCTFVAMESAGVSNKDDLDATKGKRKPALLATLRSIVPDQMVRWIDAAAIVVDLSQQDVVLNCLLGGGGGSDGNAHFSDNFMQCLWLVLDDFKWQRKGPIPGVGSAFSAQSAFYQSLFANHDVGCQIKDLSPALFNSEAVGGANASAGFSADSASNPWDYILMLEGALLFAGAASRRYGHEFSKETAFPFSVQVTPVGDGNLISTEKGPMAREVWLPLWKWPMNLAETSHLFSEARVTVGSRAAKNGVDVARAIAGFGVDRGIDEFQRIALLRGRIGGDNYFTSCDAGRFAVKANPSAEELLSPLDQWLTRFRRAAMGKNAPARAGRALRQLETGILRLCQRGDAVDVQAVLLALGEAETAVAVSKQLREGEKGAGINPVPALAADWLLKANDHSPEFRLAAALASVTHEKVGPLRHHLEPIDDSAWKSAWPKWAKEANDPSIVWGGGNLVRNLNAVLARRLVEIVQHGKAQGERDLFAPLGGRCWASLGDLTAFSDGRVDDQKIEALLRGLMLIHWSRVSAEELRPLMGPRSPSPDAVYGLLKLCHLPFALDDKPIPLTPQITRRAIAGNGAEATRLAARRLRASGFPPAVEVAACGPQSMLRIAAALMFPISPRDAKHLAKLVLRQDRLAEEGEASVPAVSIV